MTGVRVDFTCATCGRMFASAAARSGHMSTHGDSRRSGLSPEDRCPGSGMTMVSRTYTIRKIEPEDRAKYARFAQNARDRGDPEEAADYEKSLTEWEKEQGDERERLACPVCGDSFLVPTSRGASRPHRRSGFDKPSWEKARRLRKEINALQAELDRTLEALEP